eukprot:6194020-Pleurochrysis_carterae.AAC.2
MCTYIEVPTCKSASVHASHVRACAQASQWLTASSPRLCICGMRRYMAAMRCVRGHVRASAFSLGCVRLQTCTHTYFSAVVCSPFCTRVGGQRADPRAHARVGRRARTCAQPSQAGVNDSTRN